MAAKKTAKRPQPRPRSRPQSPPPSHAPEVDAVRAIAATLASHEAAIRQLAEVVVNLHQNVRALRDVVELLAERSADPRVTTAGRRLRSVSLDE
jgi:hypothetical protein